MLSKVEDVAGPVLEIAASMLCYRHRLNHRSRQAESETSTARAAKAKLQAKSAEEAKRARAVTSD